MGLMTHQSHDFGLFSPPGEQSWLCHRWNCWAHHSLKEPATCDAIKEHLGTAKWPLGKVIHEDASGWTCGPLHPKCFCTDRAPYCGKALTSTWVWEGPSQLSRGQIFAFIRTQKSRFTEVASDFGCLCFSISHSRHLREA